MSAEKIKAGEAYVRVSCDDTELKRGLQEVSERIDDAAREIENLLADADLFEHYRMALLET